MDYSLCASFCLDMENVTHVHLCDHRYQKTTSIEQPVPADDVNGHTGQLLLGV